MFPRSRNTLTSSPLRKVMKKSQDASTNIEALHGQEKTPIFKTSRQQKLDFLQNLIDHGGNVNKRNRSGLTPLYVAVQLCDVGIVEMLLKLGADVNNKGYGYSFETCLHQAVNQSCLPIVQLLIRFGADVNAINGDRETALSYAADNGCSSIAKALIAAGADVNWKDRYYTVIIRAVLNTNNDVLRDLIDANVNVNADGTTALHIAAMKDDSAAVQLLVKAGADVDAVSKEFCKTSLFLAVENNNSSVVRVLVDAGANVNWRDHSILTKSICHSSQYPFNIDTFKCLIDAKADVDSKDCEGKSALHLAIRKGNLAAFQLLVRSGADVNIQVEKDLRTPLSFAITEYNGTLSMVKDLIEAGANVNWKDKYGTMIWRAAESDREDIDVLKCLIEAGAHVNAENDDDRTALYEAISQDRIEMVKFLISSGANINGEYCGISYLCTALQHGYLDIARELFESEADVNGGPTLCYAIRYHKIDLDTIKLLLEAGCDVNRPDFTGEYPLHCAMNRKNDKQILKMLIKRGANVNCQDSNDDTPLHYNLQGDMKAIKYLLKAKANPLIVNRRGKTAFHGRYSTWQYSRCIDVAKMLKYAVLYNSNLNIPDNLSISTDVPRLHNEVIRMKNQSLAIGSEISVYDLLLQDNSHALASYVSNIELESLAEVERVYKADYPEYFFMIIKNIIKGKTRELLMHKCNILMNHDSELKKLPPEIRRKIFKLLKNVDLKNFIASVK